MAWVRSDGTLDVVRDEPVEPGVAIGRSEREGSNLDHHRSLVVAFLVSILGGCGGSVIGRTFADESALVEAAGDFVVVGRFDLAFPVTVTRMEEAHGGISFRHEGQPHDYSGFDGWAMRVMHVEGGGRAGVLVLRSKERQSSPDGIAAPPR